ncbi:MAG: DUF2255 family protein [Calditrichaeota bacterium]|nr:DUF2255 family protein [Calditrichota bacterium]
MIPITFLDAVHASNLTGVRAGPPVRDFLEIWVVVVQGRLFARSWGLAERSWYTLFLAGEPGALSSGGQEVAVRGIIPPDLEAMSAAISAEYLRKYDQGANSSYARGIVEDVHVARTMEFISADS